MSGRSDVEAKLTKVDEWVVEEFQYLHDMLVTLGCEYRDESGPGRSFRLGGRTVIRVHPKRGRLMLGFPKALQQEVDDLNVVAYRERSAAWLQYEPGVCDRDVVDVLTTSALEQVPSATGAAAARSGVPTQAPAPTATAPGAAGRDEADLSLVLSMLRAYADHQRALGTASAVRLLREAIFFFWEAPRLPPGGKYSRHLPHSAAARERRAEGHRDGFVFEHVHPISLVVRALLADMPTDTAQLRQALEASSDRVIITKAEDAALSAAGMRNEIPPDGDPWGRYRAIGLGRSHFAPLEP